MNLYRDAVGALGTDWESPAFAAFLSTLPPKAKLSRRRGGFEASLTFRPFGLYLVFDWLKRRWRYRTAMFYTEGLERFHGFPDMLEGSVTITMSRTQVQQNLGAPALQGGGGPPIFGTPDRQWDRYDFPRYSLRLDYSDEGRIWLATAMSSDLVADLDARRANSIEGTEGAD